MFYRYFRPFNFVCNIFGILKPLITIEGVSTESNLCKVWTLLVAVGLICSYFCTVDIKHFHFDYLKHNLETIPDINDLIVNVLIVIINFIKSETNCMNLHEIFDDIFTDLNLDVKILRLFAVKMYFWYSSVMVVYIVLIILECVYKYPPYILLIRIPTFLSLFSLIIHLYLVLAVLKVINHQLSRILMNNKGRNLCIENMGVKGITKYILRLNIKFIDTDDFIHLDLKLLCKIYDSLSTCIHLLEKCYGFQIFLSIWLMFTSAVVGLTVIVCDQVTIKWLTIVKSILPFYWCFIGCYINDNLSKEVDRTNTYIIKCLIDYRCVQSRKQVLETFKELVSNDRLQFTACSLFNLSYAMLLGTLLNVITYSIILIQLFV